MINTIKQAHQAKQPFVHRIIRGSTGKGTPVPAKKIYEITGYCRYSRAWELTDVEDISRTAYVDGGTEITIADY
jgi:hypothetical protein